MSSYPAKLGTRAMLLAREADSIAIALDALANRLLNDARGLPGTDASALSKRVADCAKTMAEVTVSMRGYRSLDIDLFLGEALPRQNGGAIQKMSAQNAAEEGSSS